MAQPTRCFGNGANQQLLAEYHDTEWAVPVYDDRLLFEMLILEGAHAGLSWETVLKKRAGYVEAFHNFIPEKVAAMTDEELEALTSNPAIIRHRLKIFSARKNAIAFLAIQQEHGSFSDYLWGYVEGKPIKNTWSELHDMPATTTISDRLAKDLKKRGMSFVGSTIIYAYMQAVGLVNDHCQACWKYNSAS